ncbi:transglycosylase SLT domain-containing protein [Nonomuraea sp. NPDC050663]|uniref:aggregation-promoting factor C-terminal-like domain-containing protein n=1 Tax=Nonomuraea sp. NPDC050663 TaxID=3364370 RepID=UPI0037AE5372
MDSKRALCGTLAIVALTVGAMETGTATAETDTESATAVHFRSWEADAGSGEARQGVWRADDGPARIHRRTWRTHAKPTVDRAGAWRMPNQPEARVKRPGKARNKEIARGLLRQRAWSSGQFQCLNSLWTRESNWNHRAHNRSSGAYGIPQALPGGKMSGAGRDWRHNPATQIRWGLKYIKHRYGRPCGAWGHFRSHNWY